MNSDKRHFAPDSDEPFRSPTFFLHDSELAPRIPDMTVCIAAICEGGNAIVLAADRFTWAVHAALETELETAKFSFLDSQTAWMASGSSSNGEEVVNAFRSTAGGTLPATTEVAARFMGICQDVRQKHAENRFLRRNLGMTFSDFQKAALSKTGPVWMDVYQKINLFDFNLQFIIAGIDPGGSHLQFVDECQNSSFAEFGYVAIGSGATLANVSLARRKHRKAAPLAEALYNVFEAKRTAEMAKGVGPTTDISIIRKGLPKLDLDNTTMDTLAAMFDRLKPPALSELDIASIADSLNPPPS